MRRISLWFMSTLTVLVLLFGYHTSTSSTSGTNATLAAPSDPGTTTSGGSTSADSGAATGTVTGPAADTRWGPVQVQITVAAGKVTDVQVVQHPDSNGRDRQINSRALPVLVSETLDAQSAHIDMVSGATVTSEGYIESLQGALDQAGL